MASKREQLRRRVWLMACAATLAAISACQLVAGIGSRTLDPPPPNACVLPSAGPQVRLANLVPNGDPALDICIRAAGAASWGRPLLRDGGTKCQAGFGYGHVSTAFGAPAAKVDVKLVPTGSTCDASALTEGDGLSLSASATTTLMRIGGNNLPPKIIALPEATNLASLGIVTRVRLVHAAPGTGALDFGTTMGPVLPTTLGNKFFPTAVAFGATPAGMQASLGQEDGAGYLTVPSAGYQLGAALDTGGAAGNAIFVAPVGTGVNQFTIYAIGVQGDNAHPLRGLVCEDTSTTSSATYPQEQSCTLTQLPTLSVDTFDVALYGPGSPYPSLRLNPIAQAIAQRDSDVMCVVDLDQQEDVPVIVSAAQAGRFPYVYQITTNASTPPTNPANQAGQTPPPLATPPCGGSVPPSVVSSAFSCMIEKCSTAPDPTGQDGSGTLNGGANCLSTACINPIGTLFTQYAACFDCIVDGIFSVDTFDVTKTQCTTQNLAGMGWGGANPSLILSHYPLINTKSFILPSTNFRRAVLYAQVQLEDQAVDFYCGFLTGPDIAGQIPYDGFYGEDGGATNGGDQGAYSNEAQYQVKQAVQFVQQNSQGRPAVIAGDWQSSIEVDATDGGAPLTVALNPATMNELFASWTPATAPGWVPHCDSCPAPENVYNPGGSPIFVTQPFLSNWPDATNATVFESLEFTEQVVPLPPPTGGLGQVSTNFGINIRLIRPNH